MVGENFPNCDHEDCAQEERYHDGQIKKIAVAREGDDGACAKKIPELPEDLVEQIIARMPYPSVFKARCLSKRWNLKFSQSSLSSRIDLKSSGPEFLPPSSTSVESWPSALSFQKQIALGSSQWPSYCPAYLHRDGIFAFDEGFGGWRCILRLLHIPVDWSAWNNLTYCGSLICITSILLDSSDIFVINGITRCWKRLPQCPGSKDWKSFLSPVVRIIPFGVDGYRVLGVYTKLRTDMVYTFIYDSKLETWIEKVSKEADIWGLQRQTAYVDGSLYFLGHGSANGPNLWVYDVDRNSWTSSAIGDELTGATHEVLDYALLGCGDKIMIAQHVDMGGRTPRPDFIPGVNEKWVIKYNIMIHKVIRGSNSLEVEEVEEGPPLDTWGYSEYWGGVEFMSDGECLYFGQVDDPPVDPVVYLRYNVRSEEWDTLPEVHYSLVKGRICGENAFAPGLNPFISV